jgi:hypothetical protein
MRSMTNEAVNKPYSEVPLHWSSLLRMAAHRIIRNYIGVGIGIGFENRDSDPDPDSDSDPE